MRGTCLLRLGSVRGTTIALLSSHRGIVCPPSIARRIGLGAFVWCGKRDSPTRPPLLPLNAGTAEPFRVSPPEAVAYQLELRLRPTDRHDRYLTSSQPRHRTEGIRLVVLRGRGPDHPTGVDPQRL